MRGRLRRDAQATTAPDRASMGTAADVLVVLLEPGGVATVLAAGLVTWLQKRKGHQTITVVLPDGTEITVDSSSADGRGEQLAGELTAVCGRPRTTRVAGRPVSWR